jgi:hypothetical protein
MKVRLLCLVILAAFLNSCLSIDTESQKSVSAETIERPMVQTTSAGPFRVDSVIYKPKFLPLTVFLKRLAHGDFKSARRMAPFKYSPSNVDDAVLKTLIKKGYVPVLVAVVNTSSQTVDSAGLRLSLTDTFLNLDPIPEEQLPQEFKSLNPTALAANSYNTAVVVVSSLIVLVAAAGLDTLEASLEKKANVDPNAEETLLRHSLEFLEDAIASNASGEPHSAGNFDVDNPVFNPIRKMTTIDYNGLLFHPTALDPGESARGILFFKSKDVDWSGLRLYAYLP